MTKMHPWLTLVFGIAFGYFEAAVVVYLKRLETLGQIVPGDSPFENPIVLVEIGREAASLVLLTAWGWVAGRTRGERLGHFALAFGLWDVFYYVFLRLSIGWPEGLLDWDILFLIPAPWYGPVLTPVLIALLLVAGGWIVVVGERLGVPLRIPRPALVLFAAGCALVLTAFLWNADVRAPFPESFPWAVYWPGWLLAAAGTGIVLRDVTSRVESSDRA
jgi:hypothetical protein